MRLGDLPEEMKEDVKHAANQGYTQQSRGLFNDDKIVCRKPQSLGLHFVLFLLSFGTFFFNGVYMLGNILLARRFYKSEYVSTSEEDQ